MSNNKDPNPKVDWIQSALYDVRAKADIEKLQDQGYTDDYIEGFYTGTLLYMGCPGWLMQMKIEMVKKIIRGEYDKEGD